MRGPQLAGLFCFVDSGSEACSTIVISSWLTAISLFRKLIGLTLGCLDP